jgi:endoglucanase
MHQISSRRLVAVGLSAAALLLGQAIGSAPASAVPASTLPPNTHFYTPPPDHGALRQIVQLATTGHLHDALLIGAMVTTPQAVWFTGGTPTRVRQDVHQTAFRAAITRTVPTLVAYDVPGRDCSQYSSGGAGSDSAYRAWADGFASGLLPNQRVVVVVEPDGLANLPSDCPAAYPGQDVAALTAGRIADIHYAGAAIMQADPNALVYLDAGHSAWHSVGDIAKRLDQAGVREFQGFSLNVSNYQPTPQLDQYGNWIAKCIYYANNTAEGGPLRLLREPVLPGRRQRLQHLAPDRRVVRGQRRQRCRGAHRRQPVGALRGGHQPQRTRAVDDHHRLPGQAGLVQPTRPGPGSAPDRRHRAAAG